MTRTILTSRENPQLKRVRKLLESGAARRESRVCVIDGAHLVRAALENDRHLETLFVAESALGNPEVSALLGRVGATPVQCVADSIFAPLSPADAGSGLLATMPISVREGLPPPDLDWLVLDGVQDAGNVGTMMRSAAAAGVQVAVMGPGCAHAWSPKVLRAGMGAHFALQVLEVDDLPSLLATYHGQIAATRLDGAASLFSADLRGPVAWLFGAEGRGLSDRLLRCANLGLKIPMVQGVESLNVAASAAVCLFEQLRQRAAAGDIRFG